MAGVGGGGVPKTQQRLERQLKEIERRLKKLEKRKDW